MRLLSRLGAAWRKVLAAIRLHRGVRRFHQGHLLQAASLIQEAVAMGGGSFVAHLYLGQIYLRMNRLDRAREEFQRARWHDPVRYAAHSVRESMLIEMARRFQVRHPVPGRPLKRHEVRDDFSSPEERQRFKVLPPIQLEELEHIDWSGVLELFDDPGPAAK